MIYKIGPHHVFEAENLTLTLAETKEGIRLRRKELELLRFFAESPRKVYSRDDLRRGIWGNTVSLNRVDKGISMLRRALGETSREKRFIETVTGAGYTLVAEVERVAPIERADATLQGRGLGAEFYDTRILDRGDIHDNNLSKWLTSCDKGKGISDSWVSWMNANEGLIAIPVDHRPSIFDQLNKRRKGIIGAIVIPFVL
jgi:DNA-binding winged helix-turn-helix (wHTH) protein